jgi:signal transduction histidine kinase
VDRSPESRARLTRFVRPQDIVWILLFAVLIGLGPERSAGPITLLILLGLFQVLEPKIAFFATPAGSATSFAVKLALCYLLIGWTDGVASSYFWVLLFPVISAATSLGPLGSIISTALACAAYLSFLWFLNPEQFIPPDQIRELLLRVSVLPVVGFFTRQLAEANRIEALRYQAAAEQLAEANRNLQKAEAAASRSERLAALGQLSAGLAHELRNPMGTIRTSAELLAKSVEPGNEVAREMTGYIASEIDRANSLITRFLDFARPLALRPEKADITQVIDRAIEETERHQPSFDVVIYKNYSPDIRPFYFDPELMERVLSNLLVNAAQASPPRASITVKTRAHGGMAEIAVIDRGSGIDDKHMENIFNPFFTTKARGVGLGLAIVSKIVDEHGGKISVESDPGAGSIFRVYLPARENQ